MAGAPDGSGARTRRHADSPPAMRLVAALVVSCGVQTVAIGLASGPSRALQHLSASSSSSPLFCAAAPEALQKPYAMGEVTLTCNVTGVTIDAIGFADYGNASVTGDCAHYATASCSERAAVTTWATHACVGKHSCTLDPNQLAAAHGGTDPCEGVPKVFAIAATCSGDGGGTAVVSRPPPEPPPSPPPPPGPPRAPRQWLAPSSTAIAVQAAVDHAISTQQKTVTLPSGQIKFNSAAFNITGANGLQISGDGSTTLVFSPGAGVKIENSTSSTLHTVQVDYSPMPYVHGTVLVTPAAGTKVVRVRLDPESLTFEVFNSQYQPHDTWPPSVAFAKGTTTYKQGIGGWGAPAHATRVSGRDYDLSGSVKGLVAGDVVVAPTRVGFTVTQYESTLPGTWEYVSSKVMVATSTRMFLSHRVARRPRLGVTRTGFTAQGCGAGQHCPVLA